MKIRFGSVLSVLTSFLLFCCKNRENKEGSIVQAIQQTGQLVTVEYSLSKMVRAADNNTWYKFGDRRILISTEATIKAGVDLQGITAEDVSVTGDNIELSVPPPQVFSVSIPPDKIQVLYEDVSPLRSRFTAAEREALLRQAEKQIRSLTDSLGILQTARVNAETFLRNLLQQGGYKNVTIRFEK
jgi:hypothetical protein